MSDDDNKSFMTTLYILWGSMCSAVTLFVVLPHIIHNEVDPAGVDTVMNVFVPTFGVVSLGLVGGSLVLRNILYFKKREGMTEKQRRVTYQSASIVSWAMSEAIAIFGFVCAFISGNPLVVIPFAALSLALLVFYIPRASHLTE